MAGKSLPKDAVDGILLDWRVGLLSQQRIAQKHKVSKGAVNKICKGVAQELAPIVTAGIQFNQALTPHDDRSVTAVHDAIDEHMRYQKFFRGANMMLANTVASKVREQGKSATFSDLSAAATALGRTQESVLGKTPDVVINNTNAVQVVTAHAPEELRRLNQELEDAC